MGHRMRIPDSSTPVLLQVDSASQTKAPPSPPIASQLVRPRPCAPMKLPSLREMLALYSDDSTHSPLALELPKLKCIPRFAPAPTNQWLEPKEPIRLVVRVPDPLPAANWPAEVPISPPMPAKKPLKCTMCDKRFSTKTRLRIHSVTHSCKKPFQCETCGERFAQRCGLTYHTRRVHTGERPYSCAICSRTFIQKTDLNKHRRVHERYEPTVECGNCHKLIPQSAVMRHAGTHRSVEGASTRTTRASRHNR